MSEEEAKEHFEERAGILEFIYPRREAERLARMEIEAWLKAHTHEKVEA